jgi:hypothetical protein
VTADSWPYRETTPPDSDSVPPHHGEPANLLVMPASATGGPPEVPAARMVELVRDAVTRTSPEEALRAVIEMAVESGPCDAASVTTLGPGRTACTVAYSDERVQQADRLQYQLGEGPCLDAVWTNGLYLVPDSPCSPNNSPPPTLDGQDRETELVTDPSQG